MKIPTYNARLSLTKQAPGVMVDASAAGQQARAIGQAGKALFAIGEKMKEVRSDAIANDAIIQATAKKRELEWDASQRPWSEDYDEINQKSLDALNQETINSVKDPVALQKVNQWLGMNIPESHAKMRQYGYKKLIGVRQDQLDEELYDNTQKILNAQTDEEKQKFWKERETLYSGGVSSGLFSKADADLNYKKDKDSISEKQAEWDISQDMSVDEGQSSVLKNLRDFSKYKNITRETRLDLIKKSQQRIYYNNQSFKRDVKENYQNRLDDINNKINDGTLTFTDLEQERNIPQELGGLPPSKIKELKQQHQRMIAIQLKAVTSNKDAAKKYNDFFVKFIDDKTDREKALEYLANAYFDGILTRKESQFLNKIKKWTKDIEFNREDNLFVNGIRSIKNFFGRENPDDKELASMIKNYVNGVMGGQEPEVAQTQAIMDHRIQQYPWIRSLPKEGEIRIFPDGVKRKIYPNGNIEDIK